MFSSVSSWFSGAYDWLNENVSGLPLGVFSAVAAGLPNVAIAGTKYYAPTNIDRDVLAVFSGSQWANSTITYSFPDSRSDFEWINPSASGFKPLSLDSQTAFHGIFKGTAGVMSLTSLESFTNTTFVYAGRNDANIKLSAYEPGDIINRSHGYYPGVPVYGGDTWITHADGTAALGSYQYYLLLHELGHSLGMKHTHESGGNLPKMSAQHDSTEYSVMSYNVTGRPQTFMMYDIAGLQEMYGADFTTNSGNTVYKWSPQTGETFVNGVGQGRPISNAILLTIWDGGGVDTYNFENYSTNLKIDLSPGRFSLTSATQLSASAKGNVYNALQYHGDIRSLIENAIGGSGNDMIIGNAANNVLSGNSGNDSLDGGNGNDKLYGDDGNDFLSGDRGNDLVMGGAGNDVIYGGAGADTLDGGADIDTLVYDGAEGALVDLRTGYTAGQAAGDVISGFENVVGGSGNDTVYGSADANELNGQDGN
ncbi:M10 family metallopeptidase C-terminal domain-containing protein, partial [Microvirga sp. 2MCAF35]|uniref:M10 family metallopeptidase C-terminal domain-containing protein n=1 Tax=Microvirga sp. 2MCAF35 TaxID=3232987 RepID=UPI003F97E7B9